ncbi:pheST operon leader peptide PheM [Serratia sp. D1N4]
MHSAIFRFFFYFSA